jgi:prolipoprotein diacylglyceryltransferase
MSFVITGILWALRKRLAIPGMLFFIYLIFNGVERFLIEKIRVNDILFHIGETGVTQAELISTILFFIGIGGVFWLKKKHKVVER